MSMSIALIGIGDSISLAKRTLVRGNMCEPVPGTHPKRDLSKYGFDGCRSKFWYYVPPIWIIFGV